MSLESVLKKKNLILQQIRNFFNNQKFIEVETPIMVKIPGMEPHLTPFETTLATPENKTYKLYLNHSPELQMKKLLGQTTLTKIYNITKVFRNGEIGGNLHNPEFTMLEWYRKNASYKNLMKDCEKLLIHINKQLNPQNPTTLKYQNHKIDLTSPWPRYTTQELFQKFCKIDLLKNRTFTQFKKNATQKNFDINGCETWDDIYFKIFLNHIEPNLPKDKPIFIYDYPTTQAALARKNPKNPFFAERFELYIAGIELANAFSELIDPQEQRQRLTEEQKQRKKLKKTVFDIDEEFLLSLKSIDKPSAGIALGIDRLLMIFLDITNIEDLLLFPTNKILKS